MRMALWPLQVLKLLVPLLLYSKLKPGNSVQALGGACSLSIRDIVIEEDNLAFINSVMELWSIP